MEKNFRLKLGVLFLVFLINSCATKKLTLDCPFEDFYQKEALSANERASFRLAEEGKAYLNTGNSEMALEKFEEALKVDHSNPFAYYYLGKMEFQLNNYQKSIGFLEKARLLFQDLALWQAEVYFFLGKNYELLEKAEIAKRYYQKALKINPEHEEAKATLHSIPVNSH